MADDPHAATWVTFSEGRAASLRIRRCRLAAVSGPDAGLVREFEQPRIRVGGHRSADLVLSDNRVSGVHCEILLDDTGYRLVDLDSTNGTYVGSLRIRDVYLPRGAVVGCGASELRFEALADSVERPLAAADRFGGIVGASAVMRELFARLARIAGTEARVLVGGETGTGKDLVAEAIHDASPRAAAAFVVLDCSSISPNLIESELFGHDKGAFTGATASHLGAFERAAGGTLFLDEIGELPLDLQPKLLRAIERKEVRRVGGKAPIATDIRIVAATNRDLALEVSRGRFREDLYYRLAVAHVIMPPLRDRRSDIPLLVDHFLAITPGGDQVRLKPRTIDLMLKHDWPGNVRELRNVIERAVLFSELPETTGALGVAGKPAVAPPAAADQIVVHREIDLDTPLKLAKREVVDAFEHHYVRALLARHGGNISAVARAAGVDRMSIYKIIERFRLK